MIPFVYCALLLTVGAFGSKDSTCDPSKWKLPIDDHYDTKPFISNKKLNVHLIPHTHDDPGWLINVDEYYMQRVQYILDTVVEELHHNPDRKFMYVEQAFFQRWWHQQSRETKKNVKTLVKEGRLDLTVNGGWCMHDEATTHYTAMVDQTAYGHQLLHKEFNITPRIGWQIDPFGHSSTQASLLSASLGLEALYFARVDHQDYDNRKMKKNLEFMWRPSLSRGKAAQVFTGIMIDHYGAPGHLHYDRDTAIQDDPTLHDFNVCEHVDWIVENAQSRSSATRGNHIFIPIGDDFTYINAHRWYKNLDKLIHYVNQDDRVNMLYSNLTYYTELKRAEGLTWTVKTDDFFPYASAEHDFWVGYFTSRPALKRFVRVSNTLLQQFRQIDAVYQSHHAANLVPLLRAAALVEHHDGVSGTEKQAVADDYALRLNDAILITEKSINEVLLAVGEYKHLSLCLLSNVSICDVSTESQRFEVYIHNALPRNSNQTISIPVTQQNAKVKAISDDIVIHNQKVVISLPSHPSRHEEAPYKLEFTAELKPLVFHRFMVEQFPHEPFMAENIDTRLYSQRASPGLIFMENAFTRVEIDTSTGSLVSVYNKAERISVPITLSVLYYRAFQSGSPKSGAYAFRPTSNMTYPAAGVNGSDLFRELVECVNVDTELNSYGTRTKLAFRLGQWVTIVYKLSDVDEFVEVEWTVGPIPIIDHQGKEVILRIDTKKAIQSNGKWYTDSNGLEFVERVRNYRATWNLTIHDDQEFVAANYAPVTTGAYIKDKSIQLNVVTDRAHGVGSLEDGQMEVMLHRRLLVDDGKGVNEHLNETETYTDPLTKKTYTDGLVVRGTTFLGVSSVKDGMRSLRTKMENQYYHPLVLFKKSNSDEESPRMKLPWLLVSEFPPNLGLTTIEELTKRCIRIRLSHLYAVEEHSELSKPIHVDFARLFKSSNAKENVLNVVEFNLAGTQEIRPQDRLNEMTRIASWRTENDFDRAAYSTPLYGSQVEMQAMEVRAFKLCFESSGVNTNVGQIHDRVSLK
uniref:Alpha-mannosidase n=1 Tax=Albugo laibachii Nc14 TaxID=890382 RepID=F0VYN9_9STRA|nr:lysosomal alphamannosidase putative [Albugo laibachii Nc14]|eukprot:CCA13903.1 lysosomal alphamannosidase putative [Albugo laibachii Nc14]